MKDIYIYLILGILFSATIEFVSRARPRNVSIHLNFMTRLILVIGWPFWMIIVIRDLFANK